MLPVKLERHNDEMVFLRKLIAYAQCHMGRLGSLGSSQSWSRSMTDQEFGRGHNGRGGEFYIWDVFVVQDISDPDDVVAQFQDLSLGDNVGLLIIKYESFVIRHTVYRRHQIFPFWPTPGN